MTWDWGGPACCAMVWLEETIPFCGTNEADDEAYIMPGGGIAWYLGHCMGTTPCMGTCCCAGA